MPENYEQIVDIKWTNTNALEAIRELKRELDAAALVTEKLRTEAAQAKNAVTGGTAATATAPEWYNKSPRWYGDEPTWWKTRPPWFNELIAAGGVKAGTAAPGTGGTTTTTAAAPPPPSVTPAVGGGQTVTVPTATGGVSVSVPPPTIPSSPAATPNLPQLTPAQAAAFQQLQSHLGIYPPSQSQMLTFNQVPPQAQMLTFAQIPIMQQASAALSNALNPPLSQTPMLSLANLPGGVAGTIPPQMMGALQATAGGIGDVSGYTSRAAMADALRFNRQNLQGLMEQSQAQARYWESMGDTANQAKAVAMANDYGKSIDNVNKELNKVTDTSTLWNNQLARHVMWMVQGLAIGAVFAGIALSIRSVVEEYTKLSDVSGRLMGMGAEGTRPEITARLTEKYVAAARYGVGTQEAGQAALMEQRLNLTPGMQEQGRQLAVIYGTKEYNNILTELYQTKRNLNAVGLEEFRVMDTLATVYNRVSGSAELAFDSVQASLQIYKQLGVAAEYAAVAVARSAQSMEVTPEVAAMSIQRLIRTVSQPTTQALLAQYGIDTGQGTQSTIRQIIPVMQALREAASSGTVETEQAFIDFMNIVSNAGMQSAGQAQRMAQTLVALNEMFTEADKPLDQMGKLVTNVMDTATQKIDRFKAAWQVMIATMSQDPVISPILKGLFDRLDRASANMVLQGQMTTVPPEKREQYSQEWAAQYGRTAEDIQKVLEQRLPNETSQQTIRRVISEYVTQRWAMENTPGAGREQWYNEPSARIYKTTPVLPNVEQLFQNMAVLPGQPGAMLGGETVLERFKRYYQEDVDALTKAHFLVAAEIDQNKRTALTTPGGQVIPGTADAYAATPLGRALALLTRDLSVSIVDQIKGVTGDMLQAGVDKAKESLMKLPEYAATRTEDKVKTFVYQDETTGIWKRILATDEEMNAAMKQVQENTSQIQGVFNVPEGGRVPWAAIMANYTDPSRLPKPATPTTPSAPEFLSGPVGDLLRQLGLNFVPGKPTYPQSKLTDWWSGQGTYGFADQGAMSEWIRGQTPKQWTPPVDKEAMFWRMFGRTLGEPDLVEPSKPKGGVGLSDIMRQRGYEPGGSAKPDIGSSGWWLEGLGRLWDALKPQPAPKQDTPRDFGSWMLEKLMPQPFPKGDHMGSLKDTSVSPTNINITNPVHVTVPVNVNISGQSIMKYVQSSLYETTNMQRRTSVSGRTGPYLL